MFSLFYHCVPGHGAMIWTGLDAPENSRWNSIPTLTVLSCGLWEIIKLLWKFNTWGLGWFSQDRMRPDETGWDWMSNHEMGCYEMKALPGLSVLHMPSCSLHFKAAEAPHNSQNVFQCSGVSQLLESRNKIISILHESPGLGILLMATENALRHYGATIS